MDDRPTWGSDDVMNAMTVDVEDYFHVSAFARDVERSAWDGMESRVEDNTRRVMGLFDEHGVRATFFVLGWVAERHPGLVREIAEAGHEVACHGYSHRLVYEQSPESFREETRKAKALIEQQAGRPVRGYRAASYSITGRSLWALDILAELGFEYDSSIFPVRHDRYGMPATPRFPYRILTPKGRLTEFPLTTVRYAGLSLPVAGGGYFRLLPYGVTRRALARVNRREGMPAIFYFHPWEVDPGQPRIRSSLRSRFRHYTNLGRTEARLSRLMTDFRFDTVARVIDGLPSELASHELAALGEPTGLPA